MLEWLQEIDTTTVMTALTMVAIALLIIIVGHIVIKAILRILEAQLNKYSKFSDLLKNFFLKVTEKVLWLLILVTALGQLGVEIMPLIAGLGVAGFIIGFAFQDTLGNFAAGLMILINDPYKNGDYVEAGGQAGTIREMNIMATVMTTPDNRKITIPNSKIWGSPIVNYTTMPTRRVEVKFGIHYDADIEKARDVVRNIVESHELTLSDPAPQIEMMEMADSSLNFVARAWVETPNFWKTFFELSKQIKNGLDANDITIPFPQLDVHHFNMPGQNEKAS